jgi:transcription elongation factor S-II
MSSIRSKCFNLGDAQNPQLRLSFLCGQTSPQCLAKMTSMDMASDEKKVEREEIIQKGIPKGNIEETEIVSNESDDF